MAGYYGGKVIGFDTNGRIKNPWIGKHDGNSSPMRI
jgi:hypothetical protein